MSYLATQQEEPPWTAEEIKALDALYAGLATVTEVELATWFSPAAIAAWAGVRAPCVCAVVERCGLNDQVAAVAIAALARPLRRRIARIARTHVHAYVPGVHALEHLAHAYALAVLHARGARRVMRHA